MNDLGHKDWSLRWMPSDAFCWREKKRIDICPMETLDGSKQLLLHEIAHIDTAVLQGCQHHLRFWRHLENLVQKYLGSELDDYQRHMASVYCPEFFALT